MEKPKVIVQMYPVLPAENEAVRAAKRPIGRNRDIYNLGLHDSIDIVKAADQMGGWAVSSSPDSIRFCARNGFSPVYFTPTDHLIELANVYVDEDRKHGCDLQFGANQTIVRWPHIPRDKAHCNRRAATPAGFSFPA